MATHEVTRPLALNVTALEIAQALQDVIVTAPVVDNLTTNDGSKALSAKMGKKLNDEKFAIADIASALGQDVDKVPSNKVVDDAINAINTTVGNINNLKYVDKQYDNPPVTGNYGAGIFYAILSIPSELQGKVFMAQIVGYSGLYGLYVIHEIC